MQPAWHGEKYKILPGPQTGLNVDCVQWHLELQIEFNEPLLRVLRVNNNTNNINCENDKNTKHVNYNDNGRPRK